MTQKEFQAMRQSLRKTQKQMAELLSTSLKAIQSFEQGWRKVPGHIERHLLYLVAMKKGAGDHPISCWDITECPSSTRETCPAWEFHSGHLCWFINGTICRGRVQKSWTQKMKLCHKCEVFNSMIKNGRNSSQRR